MTINLSKCNVCGTIKQNQDEPGWLKIPGTMIDLCPNEAAKPVSEIIAAITPKAKAQVAVPASGASLPGTPPTP